jgi:hypothetical protein
MLKHIYSRLAIFLLVTSPFAAAQVGQFVEAPQFAAGTNPQAVAWGDFNGDGKLDLVVANSGGNNVSVLLGNGDGTFQAQTTLTTLTQPQGVAVGQFTSSGNQDIVVTEAGSNKVSIFLGNGDGTFQPRQDFATGKGPWGVAAGDFNKDGNLDLVVTNSIDGTVSILLGNGDGTFKAHADHNTGFNPYSVVVTDLDQDGNLDVAVACNVNTTNNGANVGVVSVLRGNGDGTFQNQLQFYPQPNPVSIVAADFNGDGFPDLAVADQKGNAVTIFLGNGKGGTSWNLLAPANYPTAAFPTGVTVGDFNGDGNMDLAVSAGNGNSVSVLLGNGDGTFQPQIGYGTADIPYSPIAEDFNGDGKTDLVVANSGSNSVSVILGNGDGTFQTRVDYPAGSNPYSVATGDFNGDGVPDLVVANSNCPGFPSCGAGTISLLLGNGNGSFQVPVQYSTGTNTDPRAVAVGNFVSSSKVLDVVVANYATNTVSVFVGNGDGTFQGHVDYNVGSEPTSLAIGDFNGDGNPDLAVANFNSNNVNILLGNGDGTFRSGATYSVGHGPISVAAAKLYQDKNLDLVVVNESDNDVTILQGNGDGTFTAQAATPNVGGNPQQVVVADFNGDGVMDMAVADFKAAQVSVLLGNPNGTFGTAQPFPTVANPSSIVTADFNGDGKADLAVTSTPLGGSPGNQVSVLLGNGDGTFGAPALFSAGDLAYSAVVGDFNGDGAPDLAVANGASNTVSVLLNTQGTMITLATSGSPSIYGQQVTFTATVNASTPGSGTPTGTVQLEYGNTVLGSGSLSAGDQVMVSTSVLPVGTDTVSAVYSGDSHFRPHTVTVTQVVQKAGTSTAVVPSANPAGPNAPVTFTITVASNTSGTPTGSVTLFDGTTQLGGATLSGGTAGVSAQLAVGNHSITATYTGDSNFTGSTSPVVNEVIGSPDFQISASAPSPSTVTPPGSATSTVTITPRNGFDVTGVTLACSVSGGGSPAPTCSISTMNVSGGTGSSTLTIKTTGNSAAMLQPADLHHRSGGLLVLGLIIPAMLFGTAGMDKRNRRKLLGLCLIFLVLSGCALQMACSSGNSNSSGGGGGGGGTAAGQYTVTVTGSASGGLQHSTSVSVTVQ